MADSKKKKKSSGFIQALKDSFKPKHVQAGVDEAKPNLIKFGHRPKRRKSR